MSNKPTRQSKAGSIWTASILCILSVGALTLGGCLSDILDYWAPLNGMDAGPAPDTDADSDGDSDGDSDSDSDGDSDSDSEKDAGDDSGGCTDTETGSGTGTDADSDSDSDTDADTDADADAGNDGGATDGGPDVDCPADMVLVTPSKIPTAPSTYCIDIYEASRNDATSTSYGSDNSVARSVAGVLPWWNNPMSSTVLAAYQAACSAAGKRLCDCAEWYPACAGPDTSLYVWGDTFEQQTCNNVGACCQDYCDTYLIDPCDTSLNCGGTAYGCMSMVTTGSFTECTNDLGTYDMSGNVWEICLSASSSWGYDIRAGAFNCYSPDYRLKCGYAATWTNLYAGFRCCKDPE